VAVTTAVTPVEIAPAVAVNPAVVEPAGAETEPGTASAVELLASVTVTPLAPAAWDNVTVQEDEPNATIVDGVHATEVRDGVAAANVKFDVREIEP
jgi:hypothetical protein